MGVVDNLDRMTILHVARLEDIPQSGVANVVPNYLRYQAPHANVALLNIRDFTPVGSDGVYPVFRNAGHHDRLIHDKDSIFNSPDLVVFHEVYWPEFIRISRLCLKRKIPYVIVPHVSLTDTAQKKSRLKKLIGNALFFNYFVKKSRAIQFLSESEKDQTSRFAEKMYYIRNNAIELRGHQKKTFNAKKLELVYIGRLDFLIKGIDRIIDAFSVMQYKAREQNIKVDLYGPSKQAARELIQRHIDECGVSDLVRVHDGLFGEKKIQTMLSKDAFIQLSRTEGQPLGIMEAMDIGMPCIVTDGTTFLDIATQYEAGLAVEDDPEKIAQSILELRSSMNVLPGISMRASAYAAEHFNWEYIAPLMIKDYEKILAAK